MKVTLYRPCRGTELQQKERLYHQPVHLSSTSPRVYFSFTLYVYRDGNKSILSRVLSRVRRKQCWRDAARGGRTTTSAGCGRQRAAECAVHYNVQQLHALNDDRIA